MTFQVVFDLDGTLVDTMPVIARELFEIYRELGPAPSMSEAEFRSRFASRFDAVFLDLSTDGRRTRDQVYAEWLARDRRRAGRPQPALPFEATADLIESVARENAELFIWTTRDGASMKALLEDISWTRAFSDFRCGDSGLPPKPATPALESMLGAGCPRERVAIVGDGVSDIEAGRAWGCRTVGAAWCSLASAERLTAAGADRIARSPEQCSEILFSFIRAGAA